MTNTGKKGGNSKGGNPKGPGPTSASTTSEAATKKDAPQKKPTTGSTKAFIVLPQMNKPLKKAVVITTPSSTTVKSEAPVGTSSVPVNAKTKQQVQENQKQLPQNTSSSENQSATPTPAFQQPPQFYKKKNQWWKIPKQAQQQNQPGKKGNKDSTDGAAQMLVSPETPWFDQFPNSFAKAMKTLTSNSSGEQHKPLDERTIQEMEEAIKIAYQKEVASYNQELSKLGISSDQKWLSSVINSGTWSDKIAALALRVQESPFHNLEALDLLLGIALKKDMRSGFMAVEAIKDLLINNLLPQGRALKDFTSYSQALSIVDISTMQVPMLCWYEHQLKLKIGQVLNVLDEGLKANISHFRHQAMEITLELVSKKSEQETRLLSMLVNKMGDTDGKVSSKACESLKTLLKRRADLKSMVIREVRIFLYRPNTKFTCIFTAINFLGQIHLSTSTSGSAATKQDRTLALQLAECYLSLFEKAISAKEEGSRLLTALLNGINKVFPFLSDNDKNHSSLLPYLDQIFRLVHTANSFATSTQALALIAHMVFANNEYADNRAKKSAKEESAEDAATATAQDDKANSVRNRYYVTLYSKLLSQQTFQHAKNTLFLNLLYKSVKYDPNIQRAKAFIKRIIMCATECSPAMTAGLMFMISEIMKARPQLKKMLTEVDSAPEGLNGEGEASDIGSDSEDNDDSVSSSDNEEEENSEEETPVKGKKITSSASVATAAADDMLGNFNFNKRNPLYAVEENKTPSMYELSLMCHHFHPSVKAFADALCEPPQHSIAFTGDPLTEFSLIAFLNRFAYKNPKQKFAESLKTTRRNQGVVDEEVPLNKLFVNGEEIDESKIAPEKHFFYKFFGEREALRAMGKSRDRKKKKGDGDDEDDSSIDDEEMDRYADKLADDLMKHDAATRGEELGDDDDDDFDDMEFDEEVDDEEDDDEDDDSELVGKKNKKDKTKSKKDSAIFDFEDFKNQQGTSKKTKGKKAKFVDEPEDEDDEDFDNDFGADEAEANSGDDDDEGDFEEPEAYADSDEGDEMEEIEMSDVEEEDYDDYEHDEDFPIMLDEDDDEEEDLPKKKGGKGKDKKSKGKKGKRGRDEDDVDMDDGDDDEDVFGAAEDYEEEMDKIINTYKFETPATKIARAMKEGKTLNVQADQQNKGKHIKQKGKGKGFGIETMNGKKNMKSKKMKTH